MRLSQFSWAFFDWANQPFFTVITTFIFAPYFANVMIGNPVAGQTEWAFTQSISGLAIAILSPFLGAIADAGGRRKPFILFFQLIPVGGCVGLWWAYPHRPDLAGPIGLAVIMATIGAEMSILFNNSLLPSIASQGRIGWLSGFAWGLSYVGSLEVFSHSEKVRDFPPNCGLSEGTKKEGPPFGGPSCEIRSVARIRCFPQP